MLLKSHDAYMHHGWLSMVGFGTPSGPLAILETLGMPSIITEGEARGDYRRILKISTQLRDLLECNNWLRLWGRAFSFAV